MPSQDSNPDIRQLHSIARSSEVLFGLIMVLTFTGSFRMTGGDHDSVDRRLWAALGCNLVCSHRLRVWQVRWVSTVACRILDGVGGGRNGRTYRRVGGLNVRRLLAISLVVLSTARFVRAQEPPPAPAPTGPASGAAPATKNPWQYSLTVSGYLIENEDGFAQPVLMANHKWLHLEARYNYENFHTGSLWAGYNFSWGKTWQFEVTPMIGGVFGRTDGIAPGCEASLTWKKLNFSINNEYVFDTTSKSGDFYYNWPQITYQLNKWLNFGGVAQRTKTFATRLDVQRGFFIGLEHKQLSFTTYVFNPGSNSTSVVLEVGASF